MAGDSKLFQEALKRGSAHAWNEQWDKAAEEYRRALREFPEDTSARTYLAMALYKSGAFRESLELYQALMNAQPSNLTMLQRVAELQQKVGDSHEAAVSYGRLADAHTRRGAPKEAFRAWQKLVELTPGNPVLWNSLINAALLVGAVKEVIPGYLDLARDFALQSRFQEAIQIAERAQTLDPQSPLVAPMLAAIRKGIEYTFRAASFGEEVYPEDLMRYIPSVEVLNSRLQTSTSPSLALDELEDEAAYTSPRDVDGQRRQLADAASLGERVLEVLFRPTVESMSRGITIDAVRNELSRLGSVVEVQPRVEGRGGVVFVIMLATSLDKEFVRQAIERTSSERSERAYAGETQDPSRSIEVIEPSREGSGLLEPGPVAADADASTVAETHVAGELPVESQSVEGETLSEPQEELEAVPEEVVGVAHDSVAEAALESDAEDRLESVAIDAVEENPPPDTEAEGSEPAAPPANDLELEAPIEAEQVPALDLDEAAEAGAQGEPVAEESPGPAVDDLIPAEMLETEEEKAEIAETSEEPAAMPEMLDQSLAEQPAEATPEDNAEAKAVQEESVVPQEDADSGAPQAEAEPVVIDEAIAATLALEEVATPEGVETEVEATVVETEVVAEPSAVDEEGTDTSASVGVEDEQTTIEAEDVLDRLMREAEDARSSGRLTDAVAAYEEAVAANLAGGQQLLELGELYETMGNLVGASGAFTRALDLSPNLVQARLGLARIDLQNHKLDAAEEQARKAIESSASGDPDQETSSIELLLEVLRERAAYGDLGRAAEGLGWLKSVARGGHLPVQMADRIALIPRELLGVSVGEHLEEVTALPRVARGEVTASLRKAEQMMSEGKLRTAADEMFRVVSAYPDFLPAQSLLGRVLVAQGRLAEAGDRSRRLVELYRLRGRDEFALEVLEWMTESGLAKDADRQQLEVILRAHGRVSEAVLIEEEMAAARRAEQERRAAEEAAREAARMAALKAAEDARRAAEEAARLAEEEAIRKAIEDAARRAAAEEAVKRTLEELAKKAEEEDAAARQAEAAQAAMEPVPPEIVLTPDVSPTQFVEAQAQPVAEPPPIVDETKPKRGGLRGMFRALRGVVRREDEDKAGDASTSAGEVVQGVTGHDALLRLAESRFAFGDAKGAAALIRSALQDERIASDLATKVAMLRLLQLTAPSDGDLQDTLQGILDTLGLPVELVD